MPNVGNYLLMKTHWIKGTYLSKYDVVWFLRFEKQLLAVTICETSKLAVITRGMPIEGQLFSLTYNHLSLVQTTVRIRNQSFWRKN